MAIAFSCPSCDRTFTVDDKFAGRVTACKGCGTRMVVPDAEGEPEPPPTTARARVVAVSPPTSPPPPPRGQSRREETEARELATQEAPRSRNAAAEDAARYIEDAAKKQRRRERKARARKSESRSGVSFSPAVAGALGGVAIMVITGTWFVVALVFYDMLYYKLPIVFILGLVGAIKGMMGHED